MIRRPPRSTLTDTLFPYTTRFRSEIADFLASGDDQYEMTWQAGDPIECRHYRVTLARAYHSGGTRCLVTLVDRTAEVRTEQHLRRDMLTDSLTGDRKSTRLNSSP